MRCACAIYECEKDDFGALRLRVRPRAKTLAPLARALGGDGSFSGLDAPHPRPSLPFERFALSSGRYAPSGPAAQARLPRSSTLLDAAPTSPTSLRSDGVTGVAALALGGRGVAPQNRPFGLGLTCSPCCARYRSLRKCPHLSWLPPKHRGWTPLLSGENTPDLIGLWASQSIRLTAHKPRRSRAK